MYNKPLHVQNWIFMRPSTFSRPFLPINYPNKQQYNTQGLLEYNFFLIHNKLHQNKEINGIETTMKWEL